MAGQGLPQSPYCRLFIDNSIDRFLGAEEEAKKAKKALLPFLLLVLHGAWRRWGS
jgi:hypothetical protein